MSKLEVKIVAVGDGAVGKTCALMSFAKNEFPKRYVPTVFDNFSTNVTVDDNPILLTLWDTAGQEDYDQLRPLSYPGTDIFLMMFSSISPTSLENIKYKWLPEVREHCAETPFMLVCTKLDLREDQDYCSQNNIKPVNTDQGKKMAKELGAAGYEEMSALTQKNLHNCFNNAIRIVVGEKDPNSNNVNLNNQNNNTETTKKKKRGKCLIL
ncbi:protein racg [Anaeramoeba flamelloides]|uniref:Protein racg n=1 Tax=Anaeramoeba flamelloides TaxID=1746091 RepID=A0ABQ8X343_9EUKA|nr:protein racg [Anaeramoeba flamelloides]